MQKKIRVILWGYDKTAEMKLEKLCLMRDCLVVGVVVPDNRDASAVNGIKNISLKKNIPTYKPRFLKDNNAFRKIILSLKPDIFIVDSYSRLIPREFLDIPKLGAFNFHPGSLPEYRGAHVLNWAIVNGEKSISLTVHRIEERFDSGEILLSQDISVSFKDSINTVFKKVANYGVLLLVKLMQLVKKNKLKGILQDEARAKHYRARTPQDGKIDWSKTNIQIYNLIRALKEPWPGAFFTYKGRKIKVHQALPVLSPKPARPGTVVANNATSFCVATGSNALLIKSADSMNFDVGEELQRVK